MRCRVIISAACQMSLVLLILVVEKGRVIVLLHVLLGRLVGVHLSHLLFNLERVRRLLLLLKLLLSLDLLKLIKHVLVMEESVRELIHERLSRQESVDAAFYDWNFEQLVDRGPLSWVPLEHHGHQVADSRTEVRRQRCVLARDNFLGQLMK